MQILSVTLKNFKTHRDKYFAFSPGTNAICGENGAGKTSILEAIAWTLFNYQGEYAKDDLIRNGSGSAEVSVDFISSHDGRTYTVQRHTNKGYVLFDPQLNARLPYTRIKDEVLPWLREHLGVSPGTDLGELFARTVGVPQGTFTADFLRSPENRKTVFDKVLKVDEYKSVYKDLSTLQSYAKTQMDAVDRDIAGYEERLTAWDELHSRHQSLVAQLKQTEAQLASLGQQLTSLQRERDTLKAQAEQVQQLQSQWQQLQSQLEGQRQAIALLQHSLEQANQAAQICVRTEAAYTAYQEAEAKLQELNQRHTQRQSLQNRQQQLRKTLEKRASDLARLQVQLENFQAATAEIEQLEPQVEKQTQLEAQLKELQAQQTLLAQVKGEVQATERQVAEVCHQMERGRQDLERLQSLMGAVAEMPALEQQRDRLQQQLSRLEAARQFEEELQQLVSDGQGMCDRHQAQAKTALQTLADLQQSIPLLSADAVATLHAALEAGVKVNQDLLSQVQQILHDLSAQTDGVALRSQLNRTRKQLATLAKHQTAVATLPERQQQLTQLQNQHATLTHCLEELQAQLAQAQTLQTRVAEVQTALTTLQDPRGRSSLLARSRQQQPAVQKRYDSMQVAQTGIQRQIDDLAQQLQEFEDVDTAIATQNQIKQTHQTDYLQYLQHQQGAQEQPRLTQELDIALKSLSELQQEEAKVQTALEAAQANFDDQRVQQIDTSYQDVRSQHDRLVGSLPQQQQLRQELQRQIDALKALAEQRDLALQERKHRDRTRRFINFARKAYKEAGPRITERYVQQISREADRLFRELLNRPNVTLTWTREYEIQVQEGPDARRFVNLSGGEQMCAALAVRLALLKVLADVDIAFFDEPTTNMDRPRRESLAEAIARIKSFNQLFVISHDDTFEKVTENVIFVERDD